jgi:hypothetical protein
MKNLIKNASLVAAFAILLASCKPELTQLTASKGDLNLTSYVAIGNSLTSGFQDGGLFYEGQKSSYVNILAEQFRSVEPNLVFKTPYVQQSSNGIGQPDIKVNFNTFTIKVKVPPPLSLQVLKSNCTGKTSLTPAPKPVPGDAVALIGADSMQISIVSSLGGGGPLPASIYNTGNGTALPGPYQNMGVPGARCVDVNKAGFGGSNLVQSITPNYSNFAASTVIISNPYFSRFAKEQNTSSMLSDAMTMSPTFFSLFIGNNDVLLWASQGGASGFGSTGITTPSEFNDSITSIVKTLTSSAKQGILINVPQITGSAYFTFNVADTSKYIIDETTTPRKMKMDDLLLLTVPQDSLVCALGGFGTVSYPIPKKYTLTANQVQQATTAIDGYNAKIKELADTYGLAFFDMNAFTKANINGAHYNGMELNGTFVTGGITSLDGLHLTPRGYAALANELVKVINTKYHSTLPGVDLTTFNGVTFPNN